MHRGELYILSAPSGTGKTTLIHRLLQRGLVRPGNLEFSVSHTTRAPREGETDGVDYHFVDAAEFRSMAERNEFLEWAEVHGQYYGTSNAEVFSRLEAGVDVLLDIDIQGAEQVLARQSAATGIFVMPPSYQDLEERLRRRDLDGPEEIERRLAVSLWEIRHYRHYQYVIINDDADQASEALASIIVGKRHRLDRMEERVVRIVDDFERTVGTEDAGPRRVEKEHTS